MLSAGSESAQSAYGAVEFHCGERAALGLVAARELRRKPALGLVEAGGSQSASCQHAVVLPDSHALSGVEGSFQLPEPGSCELSKPSVGVDAALPGGNVLSGILHSGQGGGERGQRE